MDNKQLFLQLIKIVKRQLLIDQILYYFQLLLVCAGALALLIVSIAAFFVFPYWERVLLCSIFLTICVLSYLFIRNKPTNKECAVVFDLYIEDNLVTTAESSLYSEHMLSPLVLKDALRKMKKVQNDINNRKRKRFYPIYLSTSILLLLFSCSILYKWDSTFQQANIVEKEKEIIKDSQERLERSVNKKKNSSIKKELVKEKEKLKEIEDANKQYEEIMKKIRELELQKKSIEKKVPKLEDLKKGIAEVNVESLKKAVESKDSTKLKDRINALSKVQKEQLIQSLKKQNINSSEELAALLNELNSSEGELSKLNQLKSELQDESKILGEAIKNSGLEGSKQLAQETDNNKHSKQKGSSSGTDSQGNQGNQTSSNGGSQSGNGSGSSTSSGKSGSGAGNGRSASSGNGAGFGQGSREMLSVPEEVGGKENVEHDSGMLGEGATGDRFETDAPVKRGRLRPYEEVYQQYYSTYRKSSERTTIPKDLESVVESYFSEIDPGE